ncbi:MAG: GNAT family N-acetyltransferase [Pseudomonadota bacterium]
MKLFSIDVPTLAADHVILRPVRLSDASAIDHGASFLDVSRMTSSITHPIVDGATEAFLSSVLKEDRSEIVWAITWLDNPDKDFLGLISLMVHPIEDAEIGYWIVPHYWGRGVASAAVQTLVRSNPLDCEAYFGSCFVDNPASATVMMKSGFVETGRGRSFSRARDCSVDTREFRCRLRAGSD